MTRPVLHKDSRTSTNSSNHSRGPMLELSTDAEESKKLWDVAIRH